MSSLRVLSMYMIEEREKQIRNMSEGFQELANGILPELRRSRLIINYETIGRSDEQIQEQYAADPSKLSADELLYAATLEKSAAKKEEIYKKTAELYSKDYRPLNNLATLEFAKGNDAAGSRYLSQAVSVDPNAAEAIANQGLLALKNGNLAEAERNIAKVSGNKNVAQALGTLDLAKGNYAQASKDFDGVNTNCAALAQLLSKDYAAAQATLDAVESPDAMTDYLHAIVAARRANKFAAQSYLDEAIKKDPSLKTYADNDLELSFLRK